MNRSAQPLDLGILMTLAYQRFGTELHASLASSGFDDLGRSDGVVFRSLAQQRKSVSKLAKLLDISKHGAAQIATDMERRGHLARRPDPDDGRAWLLELSSAAPRRWPRRALFITATSAVSSNAAGPRPSLCCAPH